MVLANRHKSLRELSQKLFISHQSVDQFMVDVLCIRRVVARRIPKELNGFFFDIRDVVHSKFIQGQTVNKQLYLSIMKRLRESTKRKRPKLW